MEIEFPAMYIRKRFIGSWNNKEHAYKLLDGFSPHRPPSTVSNQATYPVYIIVWVDWEALSQVELGDVTMSRPGTCLSDLIDRPVWLDRGRNPKNVSLSMQDPHLG